MGVSEEEGRKEGRKGEEEEGITSRGPIVNDGDIRGSFVCPDCVRPSPERAENSREGPRGQKRAVFSTAEQ